MKLKRSFSVEKDVIEEYECLLSSLGMKLSSRLEILISKDLKALKNIINSSEDEATRQTKLEEFLEVGIGEKQQSE